MTTPDVVDAQAPEASTQERRSAPVVLSLIDALRQLRSFIDGLANEVYVARPATGRIGTIGGHVRHTLDHVSALLANVDGDELDYDARERGTLEELELDAARRKIDRLLRELSSLTLPMDRSVRVRSLVAPGQPAMVGGSTIGRELSFVLSHTIHHQAMISAVAQAIGVETPLRFGSAPATLAHLNETR